MAPPSSRRGPKRSRTSKQKPALRKASRTKVIRYAVVGLGHIAQNAILPAFASAKYSKLVALVSGEPSKLRSLASRYGVSLAYHYDQYDELLHSGEVDAVFIALPNSLHAEYAVRAAEAGVHVLCEKPLAVTEAECEKMIRAAKTGGVKLMTAYRLHFDPANMEVVERVRRGEIGEPRVFTSCFSYQVKSRNIRLDRELGGGAMRDIGIYCLNAARYVFQDEQLSVYAVSDSLDAGHKKRFREVDGTTSVLLRFPNARTALFTCSFAAEATGYFEVLGSKGLIRVDPAYEYEEPLRYKVTRSGKSKQKSFPQFDQFAAEIQYFSECIRNGRAPEPGGREGLADIRIIAAIEDSARSGKPIRLEPIHEPTPRASQSIAVRKKSRRTKLVGVGAPT